MVLLRLIRAVQRRGVTLYVSHLKFLLTVFVFLSSSEVKEEVGPRGPGVGIEDGSRVSVSHVTGAGTGGRGVPHHRSWDRRERFEDLYRPGSWVDVRVPSSERKRRTEQDEGTSGVSRYTTTSAPVV